SLAYLERTIQRDLDGLVRARNLPWVLAPKPIVRLLFLPTVHDGLLEQAVLVSKAVTHAGELQRRHRVEEAGRQSSQSAVPETRIGFLLQRPEPVDVLLLDRMPHEWIEPQVGHIVGERTANQELHREVVNALRILTRIPLLCRDPASRQDVTHRPGHRFKTLA